MSGLAPVYFGVVRLISPYPRYTATQCKIGEIYRVSINMLLFGILNAKCYMKLLLENWPLNARIWHLKRRCLAFMKLTPGRANDQTNHMAMMVT